MPGGTLHLKLRGKNLKNTERGIGVLNKSDPYFELQGSDGRGTIYKSETISNNLNPIWKRTEIDLIKLCDGNLDAPIKIVVLDCDKNGKFDLMGTIDDMSVNKLLLKKYCHVAVTHKGKDGGKIRIDEITLVEEEEEEEETQEEESDDAKKAEAEANLKEAKKLQRKAERLKMIATDKQNAATSLKEEAEEDKAEVDKLEAEAKKAKEDAKTHPCSGSLKLKIRGEKFENTDGFLRGGKSDPYYEVYGASGQVIYKSEIVQDNLNPNFQLCELDINDLTLGKLDLPSRIKFSDKDGGDDKNYLGQVSISVNDILEKKGGDGHELVKGMNKSKGKIYFENGTELLDYKDLKKEAANLKTIADDARMSYYDISKEAKTMEEEATKAIDEANEAEQQANAAMKEAEDAMAALNL